MNNTLIYLGRRRRLSAFLIKAVFWSSIGTLIEIPDLAGTVRRLSWSRPNSATGP